MDSVTQDTGGGKHSKHKKHRNKKHRVFIDDQGRKYIILKGKKVLLNTKESVPMTKKQKYLHQPRQRHRTGRIANARAQDKDVRDRYLIQQGLEYQKVLLSNAQQQSQTIQKNEEDKAQRIKHKIQKYKAIEESDVIQEEKDQAKIKRQKYEDKHAKVKVNIHAQEENRQDNEEQMKNKNMRPFIKEPPKPQEVSISKSIDPAPIFNIQKYVPRDTFDEVAEMPERADSSSPSVARKQPEITNQVRKQISDQILDKERRQSIQVTNTRMASEGQKFTEIKLQSMYKTYVADMNKVREFDEIPYSFIGTSEANKQRAINFYRDHYDTFRRGVTSSEIKNYDQFIEGYNPEGESKWGVYVQYKMTPKVVAPWTNFDLKAAYREYTKHQKEDNSTQKPLSYHEFSKGSNSELSRKYKSQDEINKDKYYDEYIKRITDWDERQVAKKTNKAEELPNLYNLEARRTHEQRRILEELHAEYNRQFTNASTERPVQEVIIPLLPGMIIEEEDVEKKLDSVPQERTQVQKPKPRRFFSNLQSDFDEQDEVVPEKKHTKVQPTKAQPTKARGTTLVLPQPQAIVTASNDAPLTPTSSMQGKGEGKSDDGVSAEDCLRMIIQTVPDIDDYDVFFIRNNKQRITPRLNKAIILFLKDEHFTVAVWDKWKDEIAYFDPLAESERRNEDFPQLKNLAMNVSPQYEIKFKFNVNPWQEAGYNKGDKSWCSYYCVTFIHNYCSLDEKFKQATEFTSEDKKFIDKVTLDVGKFPFI